MTPYMPLPATALTPDHADRPWDPLGRYRGTSVARFTHWTLEVSHRQHTLGCVILFANRRVESLHELAPDEWQELHEAIRFTDQVLARTFSPDRMNWLQLGNKVHHLHLHGVPRYALPRPWGNRQWTDATYGMPVQWQTEDCDRATVSGVADALRKTVLVGVAESN